MRSVFDGYLTDECAKCSAWSDGTNGTALGCNCIGPIMNCDAFRKMYENDSKKETERASSTVKTFEFDSKGVHYTCCIAKSQDNTASLYFMNSEGYWDYLLDAIYNPPAGLIVPPGHVCVKNEAENEGVLDLLIGLDIVQKPAYSVPVGIGIARYELCELNQEKLNEWDASDVLYA